MIEGNLTMTLSGKNLVYLNSDLNIEVLKVLKSSLKWHFSISWKFDANSLPLGRKWYFSLESKLKPVIS